MGRHIAGTLAVTALLLRVGSGPASSEASQASRASTATVASFVLVPPRGIALWMHPTAARIVVSISASGQVRACEVGTTFSHYWRGGCRRLFRGRLTLPTTGGAVHVGFRIVPVGDRPVLVERLHVQWHCVDHFFLLQRGMTKARLRAPAVFDC